jgi:hypothetical protein
MTQTFTTTTSPYRSGGWSAIASGSIGILAIGCLVGYIVYRDPALDLGLLFEKLHSVGVILQDLLMIPVAFALYRLSQQLSHPISRLTLNVGIGALLSTVLFLLLIFPEIMSAIVYLLPQGIFGAWLIFINLRMKGVLSKGLRWFGMVVGLGLILVGTFFVGYVVFVSTIPLRIPAASFEEGARFQLLRQILFCIIFLILVRCWEYSLFRFGLFESAADCFGRKSKNY